MRTALHFDLFKGRREEGREGGRERVRENGGKGGRGLCEGETFQN